MATSPIYGWLEPDNTDLVKNGALAIRTLGNAIDTTMGTMTPKSIVDAKGDLIAASANDTPARLAVGANGETLVADSSTSTGLRYQASTFDNAVYNSSFDIWQRGTSFVPASYNFGADRWSMERGTTGSTVSRQNASLDGFRYCARIQRDSGTTATNSISFLQTLETSDSVKFAGKTCTISFYARKGANYSATSSSLGYKVAYGTGTDQAIQSFTGFALVADSAVTLTTSWQRFTATFTLPSTATELGYYFTFTPTGTAGAADHFEVTGVMVSEGSVSLPYSRQNESIEAELAACQRYFAKSYSQATAPATNSSANGLVFAQSGATVANTDYFANVPLPVTMRANPTVTIYSFTSSQTGRVSDGTGTDLAAGSGATNLINDSRFTVQNNSGLVITASKNGFVFHYTVSAEL